jgi:SAM-dependent methyltransferase
MSGPRDWLRALLPPGLRPAVRRALAIVYRGTARHCPCCGGRFRVFLPAGHPPRPDAACPRCAALERHRLLWLYLGERTPLLTQRARLLLVAPERELQRRLRVLPRLTVVSGDLDSPLAAVRLDVQALPFPDGSMDVILCSHVLEHVADARRALVELHRVLRPGGWAILQSPFDPARATTLEDPRVTDPRERERVFGQRDHARIFGRDYPQWLAGAGFEVRVDGFVREHAPEWIRLHGLDPSEDVHVCVRPAAGGAVARTQSPP